MKLPAWLVGEFAGTFLLVFFGCGSVATAVLAGGSLGLFEVALVWGVGIALAIHLTSALSGAHLNPAVTWALVSCGRFPRPRVLPYVLTQLAGAFVAAAVLHGVFAGFLTHYEAAHGLVRGMPGSEASAMILGEYFPNPGGQPWTNAGRELVSPWSAFLVEALGTAVLVLAVLGLTDEHNVGCLRSWAPAGIGLTVTLLICLFAPLTQAGFNPARDLGPRLWSALAGWGAVPFHANGWGWLTVYVLGPLAGGQVGAGIYLGFFRPHYLRSEK